VQRRVWEFYARVDDRSINKSASLIIVSQAEERIARLEGTLAPDSLNEGAPAEAWEVMTDTLVQAGDPDLLQRYLHLLQQRLHGSGVALGCG
jgi:hypothetical protein